MRYINLNLFPFIKAVTLFNNKAVLVEYQDGYTSFEVLFEGSKLMPRKLKKRLRKLIK